MSAEQDPRDKALEDYKRKLLQHKEVDSKVRALREDVKTSKKEYDKTEDDLKALQSVGQIIGEVLRQLDEERCECLLLAWRPSVAWEGIGERARQQGERPCLAGSPDPPPATGSAQHNGWCPTSPCHSRRPAPASAAARRAVIVKSSSGPRYVVGCRSKVDKEKLTPNTRVALDVTTLTIMRILPREVDPVVFNMTQEDPGKVDYSSIGGLSEQIRWVAGAWGWGWGQGLTSSSCCVLLLLPWYRWQKRQLLLRAGKPQRQLWCLLRCYCRRLPILGASDVLAACPLACVAGRSPTNLPAPTMFCRPAASCARLWSCR